MLNTIKLVLVGGFLSLTCSAFAHADWFISNSANDSLIFTSSPDSVAVDSTIIDKIPPLKALIDSAISNSNLLNRQEKQVEIKELRAKSITQEWLKYINVFATSNYGVYDNFMSIQDQSVIGSSINTGTSYRWSVGVTFSGSPLFDFINKPTMRKIQLLEAEQEENTYQELVLQIKKLVIEQFNLTLMSYQILVIANQNVYSNYTQLVMSEQKFYDGEMELFALANVREMYFKSLMSFEKSKYEFQMNYLILETICGFNF